jgi:hypothetical protein
VQRYYFRDYEMKHDARIAAGDRIDDGRNKARGQAWMTSDPQFPSCRVGEKFDFLHALAQVIEHRDSAFEHRPTVLGRLDAAGSAVKQVHAKCPLEFRDRSGNGRLIATIHDRDDLAPLVENPMLLTVVCVLYDSGGRLPEDR